MKRFLIATAALVAAVAVFALMARPPRRVALTRPWDDGTVAGVLHVHTNRSDGRSSPDAVAAAAARAGLKFLVFTDHGDATRTPDPPAYRSGVLCLDGVEISTRSGHVVAIDMPASPYPLAGEARDVVDDIHRLGGFAIAAHPDSPKRDLQWGDWTVPVDGIEVINPDTSWRLHFAQPGWRPKLTVLRALFTYPLGPGETIGSLLTPSPIDHWTQMMSTRPVVALAGVDAHARLELRDADPGDNRYSLPFPSYAASFDVLSTHVSLRDGLSGDAARDARQLLDAIRAGRVYTAVDAWAGPPSFELAIAPGTNRSATGEPVVDELRIRSNAPETYVTSVWNAGRKLAEKTERAFVLPVGRTGAFWAEIRDPGRPRGPAWLTSSALFVAEKGLPRSGENERTAPGPGTAPLRSPSTSQPLWDGRTLIHWNTEADPTSQAMIDVAPRLNGGTELRLRFALSGGSDVGQFAGATVDTPQGVADFDRVTFNVRAEHPMRISVQVRVEVSGAEPERYQRSIYVDTDDRMQSVSFADMSPVGATQAGHVPQGGVRTIMFLVETPNTKPGTTGRVWIREPRLER
jgi:hypothetical protein